MLELSGTGLTEAKEWVSISKDVVLALCGMVGAGCAVFGARIAKKGLGTWQRQMSGQAYFELTKRILVGIYKLRTAVYLVRHPAIYPSEMPFPSEDERKTMDQSFIHFYGFSGAYAKRWDKVIEAENQLEVDLLEAEAIWGPELKDHFNTIRGLIFELNAVVRYTVELDNPRIPEEKRQMLQQLRRQKREILYDLQPNGGISDADVFKHDFEAAVVTIETYLRSKIAKH